MSETPVSAWTPDGEQHPPLSEEGVIAALKTVFDPEIPVDIYELGLVYAIEIGDDGSVKVEMTLTTPSCPSAQELPFMAEQAVGSVPGVTSSKGLLYTIDIVAESFGINAHVSSDRVLLIIHRG